MSCTGRVLHATAEACPLDALLVAEMRAAHASLLKLNLKGFRTQKYGYFSAVEIVKQALELLFEFGVSTKSYREAFRTIRVYSQGDEEAIQEMSGCFLAFANAAYSAYAAQKHVETLSPQVVFLEGTPLDMNQFHLAFRSVGVKPPLVVPASAKKVVYLDEGYQPYSDVLQGKRKLAQLNGEREQYWAKRIVDDIANSNEEALLRVRRTHLIPPRGVFSKLTAALTSRGHGKLQALLQRNGISVRILSETVELQEVFGRK